MVNRNRNRNRNYFGWFIVIVIVIVIRLIIEIKRKYYSQNNNMLSDTNLIHFRYFIASFIHASCCSVLHLHIIVNMDYSRSSILFLTLCFSVFVFCANFQADASEEINGKKDESESKYEQNTVIFSY